MSLSHRKHVEPHQHLISDIKGSYKLPVGDNSAIGDAGNVFENITVLNQAVFKDPADNDGDYININVIMLEDPAFPGTYNPLLEISEGIYAHKDIFAYGALMTASPVGSTGGGAIQIGARFEHASDPPRINLTQGGVLAITAGSTYDGETYDLESVLAGIRADTVYTDNLKKVNGDAWSYLTNPTSATLLPSGASIDLGSTEAPFNDVISLYGHIGNMTVSNNLYANAINTVTEADLDVNLNEGYSLVVNGGLEVTDDVIGDNTIDIGSEGTPFHDFYSLYAHIGNITASNNLYVNAINTITAANLAVNLNEGYDLIVNGDLQVNGGVEVDGDVLSADGTGDIGSTGTPWNDIISLYAHIGNVTVSNNLYVNAINTITAADLPVNLSAGKRLKVIGDLEVTGSLIGGGSGIQSGSSSTNASGVATVNFGTAFGSTPKIVVTPVDASARCISVVITAQSTSAFSVKTMVVSSHDHSVAVDNHYHSVGSHTHQMGTAEITSAFSMGVGNESSHTHQFGTLGSGQYAATPGYLYFHELGLGGQTCGLTVASASFGPHASLNTGGGSSHTHSLTSAPLYYRGLTLGGVGCGSLLTSNQATTAQTLTTGSGSGNTGNATATGYTDSKAPANVSVNFNWIAVP
jgi:hypothetical protein